MDELRKNRSGSASTTPLVCPSCARPHGLDERFCSDCGMPLVRPGVADPPTPAQERARKIDPRYAQGETVKVAFTRNLAESDLIQNILLEEGIPSIARRTRGFDVPDFLAAGPRDILVASSGLDAAREILGDPQAPRRLPEQRHPAWVRALAITLSLVVLVVFAAGVAVPFFD